ncbi:MAG TPA: hypothetical protein V6D35_07260 [Candidatus Sericytochromatia bacterium]|jgi:hypothetical protein
MSEAIIEENLKQFLLVLAVSLSVATLPQVFSWFRRIPYTLLLFNDGMAMVAFSFLVGFSLKTTELTLQPVLAQFFAFAPIY